MPAISTFELLLKPQLPKSITNDYPELMPLARIVLQGYFLTVANLDDKPVTLSLIFVSRTPGLQNQEILAILDTQNQNGPLSLVLDRDPAPANQPEPPEGQLVKTKYTFSLNPNDTGLVLVQPNAANETLRMAAEFEIRGYVELSLSASNMQRTGKVLITAEHRATFYDGADLQNRAALGEISSVLPLATGGSLLELERS
jgi:hypothetical protein